ncbi:DUF3147 family protein [Methyloligella solikamskensis]|uniref:DUF3147 family protein n=1 Tax=Methyloligella solikamskensis TaxID=1177756 RepID=A0ABW3J9G1_9HYPH
MLYATLKLVITAVLIVIISEIGKRSSVMAAILASIPLVSVLAMIWLYIDTKDVAKIESFATSVFWLVLPSLILFITLPLMLQRGMGFYLSLGISVGLTVLGYLAMLQVLKRYGIAI